MSPWGFVRKIGSKCKKGFFFAAWYLAGIRPGFAENYLLVR